LVGGAADGPAGASPSSGNAVSENVVYTPWLGEYDPAIGRRTHPDTDKDGIPDDVENQFGLNSFDPTDALQDSDSDDWTNLQEYHACTSLSDETNYPTITVFYVGFEDANDRNLGSPRYPLATLHTAIDRINSLPHGNYILHLASGTYSVGNGEDDATLTLDHNLTIIGQADTTIVDGQGATNWTTGLGATAGVSYLTIENVNFQNFVAQGINLAMAGGCVNFAGVGISASDIGLQLVETYQVDVDLSGSFISDCRTGIKVAAGSSNNVLRNGVVSSNFDGIRLEGDRETPDDNRFEGIDVLNNAGNGIVIHDGSGNVIADSQIMDNNTSQTAYGGIAVFAGCNEVVNSTITQNECHGVYADDALATQPFVAVDNVWDDNSGPRHPLLNPAGAGNAVSDHVIFVPWTGYEDSSDADNDGWPAQAEMQAGTDPNDGSSYPDNIKFYVGGMNADDDNVGTLELPLQTLHGAVHRINGLKKAIYEIELQDGATITAASEETDAPIVFNQNVVIYGNGATLVGAADHSGTDNLWISGLIIGIGAEDVEIRNLRIQNFTEGIRILSDGGCVKLLEGVNISDCATGLILVEAFQVDVELSDSVISDCQIGIKVAAGSSNNLIRNGAVTENADGIRVEGDREVPDDNRFEGIQVTDNSANGIIIYDGWNNEIIECLIANNNLGEFGHGGVAILSGGTIVHDNNIQDNHCFGVWADDALSTAPVDAALNWWGATNGPAGVGPGSGNAVSEYIDYAPFRSEEFFKDSDNDGWPDTAELQAGTNPNDQNDYPQNMTVFHVGGPDGSNASLGTSQFPLRSLHEAMRRINNSHDEDYTIHLANGFYDLSVEADEPLVPVHNVSIIGSDIGLGAIIDGSGAASWTAAITLPAAVVDVSIRDVTIRNFAQGVVVHSEGSCIDLAGVDIYNCETGLQLVESYMADINLNDSVIRHCELGIKVAAGSSNNLIRGGIVRNNSGDGIRLDGESDTPEENHFQGIQVSDNAGNGIILFDGAGHRITECVIGGNNLDEDAFGGVAVLAAEVEVSRNIIVGNRCHGVWADDALAGVPLNAVNNWWGADDGPAQVGSGSGDRVSEHVVYEPWLGVSPFEDSDFDGLGDVWENAQFGDLDETAEKDSDGDGWNNLAEFQAQTLANEKSSSPTLTEFQVGGPGANDLNLGDASRPLKTLHGAADRINGLTVGSYTVRLKAGTYCTGPGCTDVMEPDTPLFFSQDVTILGSQAVLSGSAADGWAQALWFKNGAENVTIKDLTIQGFETGVMISTDGGCVEFENTVIESCATGLKLVDSYQMTIDLNDTRIQQCTTAGIHLTENSSSNLIQEGTVQDNAGDGIVLEAESGACDDNTFSNMFILDNHGNGFIQYEGSGNQLIDSFITGNNTSQSAYGGVAVLGGCLQINRNQIEGNNCCGVFADDALSTEPVDALENWWGSADGPSQAGPSDSGDGVSENVLFDSWLRLSLEEDGDNDGLPDFWEDTQFGNGDQDADDDTDNDGWPNLAELQGLTLAADANDTPDRTEFYVGGPDADNNNLGSLAKPLANLHGAAARIDGLPPGNYTIILNPGTYCAGSACNGIAEPDQPLTFSQNVTIRGTNAVLENAGAEKWTTALKFAGGTDEVTIEGVTIRGFEYGLMIASDGGCFDLNQVVIEDCVKGLTLVDSYQVTVNLDDSEIRNGTNGIYVTGGSSNNLIQNGRVHNNAGDGIRVESSNQAPDSNHFEGIEIFDNGQNGLALIDGFGHEVRECEIFGNNTAETGYGGIAVLTGFIKVQYNIIEANQCAGVYVDEATAIDIHGNLIRENADGIRLSFTSDMTISSNTITENGVGLVIEPGSQPKVLYNIIWGNPGGSTDLVAPQGYTGFESEIAYNNIGTSNLTVLPDSNTSYDPVFNADYTLSEDSPCIEGTDVTENGRDQAGDTRPQGTTWDIGAYEAPNFGDIDDDGLPDWWEIAFFGSIYSQNAEDDSDNDGNSNIHEYRNRTNPTNNVELAITNPQGHIIWMPERTLSLSREPPKTLPASHCGTTRPIVHEPLMSIMRRGCQP